MLQRSIRSGVVLSAAVIAAASFFVPSLRAQDAAPETAAPTASAAPTTPAAPAADDKNKVLADDFMHYSLVNNVEMAKASGQSLLDAKLDPAELVRVFEDAARDSARNPREIMIRNQRRDELKEVSAQLLDKLDEGYRVVARDAQRIRKDIDRLAESPRAYKNAADRLIAAGQFAVPIYMEYLQNAQKKELHPFILRVIVDTGRPMVLPLVEQLQTSDTALRLTVINLLGQIGYKQSLPALRALQSEDQLDAQTKTAIGSAIALIDRSGAAASATPAALFLKAGENYYAKEPSFQPILATEKTNPIWIFDKGLNNVTSIDVPTQAWSAIMAARAARTAIQLDPNNASAISLWIAAQLKKEILLAGAPDPTMPNFHADYIALASGPLYDNPVLSRALDARDVPLALRAIDALKATGGTKELVSSTGSPLVRALGYPSREVRFSAAIALAQANPAEAFPSHYRVVPILAEAISSTGTPNALVVIADDDKRNKLADTLRNGATHFNVYAASTMAAALEIAHRAPAFDVVIVGQGAARDDLSQISRTDYRLAGAPVLLAVPASEVLALKAAGASPIDEAADDAAITAALADARADLGNAPLDPDKASQYAITAVQLLGTLAADHKSIYNVADALPALTEGLKDKRVEIATGSAVALGKMRNIDAQKAIAAVVLSADLDAGLRAPFFNALTESARNVGNNLDTTAINSLIKIVNTETDAAVRTAAGAALGALNIPSNQAAPLILAQPVAGTAK
ncbi:MAG: hypothetical protein FWD61_11350 [Phycisphaerales bacterium]|nr:hypothetical protein [Phycisphaerales bacterium]